MRLTVTNQGRVEADVFVHESDSTNAIRAAIAGNLRALVTVSEPWGNRARQGRPIIQHRDGTLSIPTESRHVKVNVSLDIEDIHQATQKEGTL